MADASLGSDDAEDKKALYDTMRKLLEHSSPEKIALFQHAAPLTLERIQAKGGPLKFVHAHVWVLVLNYTILETF